MSDHVGWDHPRYEEWKSAVANDETVLGLKDWLESNPANHDVVDPAAAQPTFECDDCDFNTKDASTLEPLGAHAEHCRGEGMADPDGVCPNCGGFVAIRDPGLDS